MEYNNNNTIANQTNSNANTQFENGVINLTNAKLANIYANNNMSLDELRKITTPNLIYSGNINAINYDFFSNKKRGISVAFDRNINVVGEALYKPSKLDFLIRKNGVYYSDKINAWPKTLNVIYYDKINPTFELTNNSGLAYKYETIRLLRQSQNMNWLPKFYVFNYDKENLFDIKQGYWVKLNLSKKNATTDIGTLMLLAIKTWSERYLSAIYKNPLELLDVGINNLKVDYDALSKVSAYNLNYSELKTHFDNTNTIEDLFKYLLTIDTVDVSNRQINNFISQNDNFLSNLKADIITNVQDCLKADNLLAKLHEIPQIDSNVELFVNNIINGTYRNEANIISALDKVRDNLYKTNNHLNYSNDANNIIRRKLTENEAWEIIRFLQNYKAYSFVHTILMDMKKELNDFAYLKRLATNIRYLTPAEQSWANSNNMNERSQYNQLMDAYNKSLQVANEANMKMQQFNSKYFSLQSLNQYMNNLHVPNDDVFKIFFTILNNVLKQANPDLNYMTYNNDVFKTLSLNNRVNECKLQVALVHYDYTNSQSLNVEYTTKLIPLNIYFPTNIFNPYRYSAGINNFIVDENNNAVPRRDNNGNVLYRVDENKNFILDENGNKIPSYEKKYDYAIGYDYYLRIDSLKNEIPSVQALMNQKFNNEDEAKRRFNKISNELAYKMLGLRQNNKTNDRISNDLAKLWNNSSNELNLVFNNLASFIDELGIKDELMSMKLQTNEQASNENEETLNTNNEIDEDNSNTIALTNINSNVNSSAFNQFANNINSTNTLNEGFSQFSNTNTMNTNNLNANTMNTINVHQQPVQQQGFSQFSNQNNSMNNNMNTNNFNTNTMNTTNPTTLNQQPVQQQGFNQFANQNKMGNNPNDFKQFATQANINTNNGFSQFSNQTNQTNSNMIDDSNNVKPANQVYYQPLNQPQGFKQFSNQQTNINNNQQQGFSQFSNQQGNNKGPEVNNLNDFANQFKR